MEFVLKSDLSKTVTFFVGDTFFVDNFHLAAFVVITQNFFEVALLDLWLVKIVFLDVLDRLDVRHICSLRLAGLDAHACLLVEKLDEGIVGHVFTSINKPLSLDFNIILDLLEVLV